MIRQSRVITKRRQSRATMAVRSEATASDMRPPSVATAHTTLVFDTPSSGSPATQLTACEDEIAAWHAWMGRTCAKEDAITHRGVCMHTHVAFIA